MFAAGRGGGGRPLTSFTSMYVAVVVCNGGISKSISSTHLWCEKQSWTLKTFGSVVFNINITVMGRSS